MQDFAALIEPLIPRLRRYSRSLLKDTATADDLVQDCLERALSHWHQRRADGEVRTWVFTILHNLAVNRMRSAARRGPHLSVDHLGESALAQPETQGVAIEYQDVMRALDALPVEQREVLLLIAVEDFSYAQAAQTLNVPVGTVMSRLSRARTRLREIIEGRDHPAANRLRRVK